MQHSIKQPITNTRNHAPEECAEAAIEEPNTQIGTSFACNYNLVRLVMVGKSLDQIARRTPGAS